MATKNRRLTAEKQKKVYQDWLVQSFPALFNESFLPMPLGIFDQLSMLLPEHISKTDLRVTLGWYASRIKYLQNICAHTSRLNLDGTEASLITEEEKMAAEKKMKEIFQAKKKLSAKQSNPA
jgi:sRNA-binding protein